MGKRRVGFKKPKSRLDALPDAASSDEENALEAILDDEIEQFNSQKEQALLEKGAKKSKAGKSKRLAADDDEEVYPLDLSDDDESSGRQFRPNLESDEGDDDDDELGEEDDDDDGDDDDILGKEDYDIRVPDSRAWGSRPKLYHNTDYVDQDFGGMEGEDAENAELEEAEAKEIQKRLTEELDESDFTDFLPVQSDKKEKKKKESGKEFLKVSLDSLSALEKRKLVEQQCPEVIHLLEEYNDKLNEAVKVKSKLEESSASQVLHDYYATKYHLMLNYCMNISFYLLQRLRNPLNCKGHPVIKKILQYRRLLDELAEFDVKKASTKYLNVEPIDIQRKRKASNVPGEDDDETLENKLESKSLDDGESDDEDGEVGKRKITYEMAKNKGLMPHRKKEQRNPRVKHREKFRKAKIRRRGQVRTARTEKERYGGEASGIKAFVTKSIKLK